MRVNLLVNGSPRTAEIEPTDSLLDCLREGLDLWGTKNACEQGECGSCTVVVDGRAVCSCLVLAAAAEGAEVTTVEGLAADPVASVVRRHLLDAGGVQCGFCTPGFVVAATDLLRRATAPSEMEIREALAGNLCRCTGYVRIVEAVRGAGEELAAVAGNPDR